MEILVQSNPQRQRTVFDLLTQQGIRATFKVVGEKGRVLERRGRKDVIAALARHEIGYIPRVLDLRTDYWQTTGGWRRPARRSKANFEGDHG